MVLESLISPSNAEKRPFLMFFLGFLYSSVGLLLGYLLFRNSNASLVMIFLTTLATAPLMYKTMRLEEKKDIEINKEKTILKEHGKAIFFLTMFFIGMTASFTIWNLVLPAEHTSNLFNVQRETLVQINGHATLDQAISNFSTIFFNNIKVLIFCIIFSLTYGLGSIFILTWNASVIGVALGNFLRNLISDLAYNSGMTGLSAYLYAVPISIMRYAIHGIPEMIGYFIGGLAGGILSISIINHDFGTKKYEKILFDVSNLLIIAFLVIFVAGLIEVFITPALF